MSDFNPSTPSAPYDSGNDMPKKEFSTSQVLIVAVLVALIVSLGIAGVHAVTDHLDEHSQLQQDNANLELQLIWAQDDMVRLTDRVTVLEQNAEYCAGGETYIPTIDMCQAFDGKIFPTLQVSLSETEDEYVPTPSAPSCMSSPCGSSDGDISISFPASGPEDCLPDEEWNEQKRVCVFHVSVDEVLPSTTAPPATIPYPEYTTTQPPHPGLPPLPNH